MLKLFQAFVLTFTLMVFGCENRSPMQLKAERIETALDCKMLCIAIIDFYNDWGEVPASSSNFVIDKTVLDILSGRVASKNRPKRVYVGLPKKWSANGVPKDPRGGSYTCSTTVQEIRNGMPEIEFKVHDASGGIYFSMKNTERFNDTKQRQP
jgi:hypothetical protein